MFNRKIFLFTLLIVIVISSSAFYFNVQSKEQKLVFTSNDFSNGSFIQNWNLFSQELQLTNEAKIEDFKLILNENNGVESIRFNVIEKRDNQFIIYNINHCFSCTDPNERVMKLEKRTVSKNIQYSKLINGDRLFNSLDLLSKSNTLRKYDSKYLLIQSSGLNEKVGLEGEYYSLANNELVQHKGKKGSKGHYFFLIPNDTPENFETDKNTSIIILSNNN